MSNGQKIKELLIMGYSQEKAKDALARYNWDLDKAKAYLSNPSGYIAEEQTEPAKALGGPIYNSPNESEVIFGQGNPRGQKKTEGLPVGLMNVAKNSYLNSVLQWLFMLPSFAKAVIHGSHHSKLAFELQRLFCYMARGNKKYSDPSLIINELSEIQILGDLLDFNLSFLYKLQEGVDVNIVSMFNGETIGPDLINREFLKIPLDVTKGDLETAWNHCGLLISAVPEVLILHVQRVSDFSKVHQKFTFPFKIYLDTHLYKNKEVCAQLMSQKEALDKKLSLLKESISKFEDYKGHSLEFYLKGVLSFLQSVSFSENLCSEDIRLYSPGSLDNISTEQIEKAKQLIIDQMTLVNTYVTQMKTQLQENSERLSALFNVAELQEYPYELHTVLMHDGDADGGYYYSYVYDDHFKIWRRYRDIQVINVTDEEVLTEGSGGRGKASAYALIYAPKQMPSVRPVLMHHAVHNRGEVPDEYNNLIPPELMREIDTFNEKFKHSIEEYQSGGKMKDIQEHYKYGYEKVMHYYLESQSETKMDYDLVNFALFIRRKGEEELLRWYLLDSCLNDLAETDIRSLTAPTRFHEQFKRKDIDIPSSMYLTRERENAMNTMLRDFTAITINAEFNLYLAEQLINNNLNPAVLAVNHVLSMSTQGTKYYQFTQKLLCVLLLKIADEMVHLVNHGAVIDAVNAGKALMTLTSLYCEANHWVYNVILEKLNLISYASQEFINIVNGLDSREIEPSVLHRKSKGFEKFKARVENQDMYTWTEGWHNDKLACKYVDIERKIVQSPLNSYFNIVENK